MKSKLGHLIFTAVAVLLAGIFIWLTLKQTRFEVLKEAAEEANYFWFVLSMILSIVSYWLRAKRWTLLLGPMGYTIPVRSGFWAIAFGYFMNLTIPRSGEIARATSLYKMEDVPVDKTLGTIVLERVIDLIFLLLFFGITLAVSSEALFSFFSFGQRPAVGKFLLFGGIALVMLVFLFVFRKKLHRFGWYRKAEKFLFGIWTGFKSILKLKERTAFVLYTIGIWTCYYLMTYLVVFAFPATSDLGWNDGFFLVVAGAMGMILPAVAGLGYPYVISIAFAALWLSRGMSADEGQMVGNYFGLMLYFAQVITMLSFGILSLFYIGKSRKNLAKFEEK